ncbi:hypothetical protein [Leucobacter soli]|uniref:hypothetical protein n=1 Tax=Leucobacter soli TaxID=2812850 RepID=UPI003621EB71
MTDSRSQQTYQVRLGWGRTGSSGLRPRASSWSSMRSQALTRLPEPMRLPAPPGSTGRILGRGTARSARRRAAARPDRVPRFPAQRDRHGSGGLRGADRPGRAHVDQPGARRRRGGFAVEDYLAAGAIADALTTLGIDHSAPDVAVAAEGFRPLKRAVKHLFAASAAGQELKAAGHGHAAKAAAELDADGEAIRFGA